MATKMTEEEIGIEVLPSGCLRFRRGSKEHNEIVLTILKEITDNPQIIRDLEEFFAGAEDILVLEGDGIFCG